MSQEAQLNSNKKINLMLNQKQFQQQFLNFRWKGHKKNKTILTKEQFHLPKVIQDWRLNNCGIKHFYIFHVNWLKYYNYISEGWNNLLWRNQCMAIDPQAEKGSFQMRGSGNKGRRVKIELDTTQIELMINYTKTLDIRKLYWKAYNGKFKNYKIHGKGIFELINESCVCEEFTGRLLHGQQIYECMISKQQKAFGIKDNPLNCAQININSLYNFSTSNYVSVLKNEYFN
ncbi:unnamed protein product [Paramecium octaurelia]|uniref:Uncharacterized protein n=1 Tax=Paramecium octaurelia TaxID=43137 RepID=A0A8S1UUZ2_PAROT|nr:unnamed protein product [Paramecium octaurelia]